MIKATVQKGYECVYGWDARLQLNFDLNIYPVDAQISNHDQTVGC